MDEPGCPSRRRLRLYRATAGSQWILAKDGRPDHRISVPLTLWTATGSSRSTALTCAWTLLATRLTPRSCLASQLPLRSLAAYFFQGRSIRNGMSSRTGAGTAFIM